MWSPDAEKVVDQIASPWSPEEAEVWYHSDFSTRKLFGPNNFTAMMITGYNNNRKPIQLYFVGGGHVSMCLPSVAFLLCFLRQRLSL